MDDDRHVGTFSWHQVSLQQLAGRNPKLIDPQSLDQVCTRLGLEVTASLVSDTSAISRRLSTFLYLMTLYLMT